MTTTPIRVLTLDARQGRRGGGWEDNSPYIEHGSYPWYAEVGLHATQEGAAAAAQAWAELYVSKKPLARMACVHGVVRVSEPEARDNCCWAGVVNYYHSNS